MITVIVRIIKEVIEEPQFAKGSRFKIKNKNFSMCGGYNSWRPPERSRNHHCFPLSSKTKSNRNKFIGKRGKVKSRKIKKALKIFRDRNFPFVRPIKGVYNPLKFLFPIFQNFIHGIFFTFILQSHGGFFR